MGGVTTGVLILICLAFFMPYCAFIPKASCLVWKIAIEINQSFPL
jgi:MFS superfamily sulfate permease-like transporter